MQINEYTVQCAALTVPTVCVNTHTHTPVTHKFIYQQFIYVTPSVDPIRYPTLFMAFKGIFTHPRATHHYVSHTIRMRQHSIAKLNQF